MNFLFWLKETKCKEARKIPAKMGFPGDSARSNATKAKHSQYIHKDEYSAYG